MSPSFTASDIRSIVHHVRCGKVMDALRGCTFIGALLLAWISLRPFEDLSSLSLANLTTGNETMTYAVFGLLVVFMLGLAMRDNMQGLASLLSPGFILFGGWILVTVVLSLDPGTSIRRLALTVCVIGVAATLMLLPKTQSELMRWFSIAALILLAVCYVGILLVPHLSIHQATDPQEPALAGNWRGSFGHKNVAAAVMAMLLFIGIYVARSGAWLSGLAIIALSSLFLLSSAGKSSLTLCFAVLLLTSLTSIVRPLWCRMVMLLLPLLLLNMLSVGTVMSDSLAAIAKMLPLDSSFTGRVDIWTFAVQAAKARLPIGYGFSSFWGSSSIKNLPEGMEWAAFAAHSHNGYLDTTLAMGLPGLVLLLAVMVIAPLRNFHKADVNGNNGPLALMLLQVWLFGLYLSAMESFFLDRADPLWFTFLVAVFGLHYLARFRLQD